MSDIAAATPQEAPQRFAVQTLAPGAESPDFHIVSELSASAAPVMVSQMLVEKGDKDTQVLAIFSVEDVFNLYKALTDPAPALAVQG